MTVYYYGCNCGTLGTLIRKVKSHYDNVNLKNSKYSETNRAEHREYLTQSDISTDRYLPILVKGDNVILLSLWQP